MSATPVSQPPFDSSSQDDSTSESAQSYASTDLVSKLYREQNKIHDLLSSLSFALRSLRNLNQFLELIPLIASRVTDTDGGALVLFKADGQIQLERLHCQAASRCQSIRAAMELATRRLMDSVNRSPAETLHTTPELLSVLDQHVSDILGAENVQWFGTPILVGNTERGRLYIFSYSHDFAWTDARQKLVRLVSDQTSVAIENDELNAELRNKERLDRELEIGAEIQSQLLPRQCPTVEGITLAARCKNASRVGGDYYDFVPADYDQFQSRLDCLEQGRWSITIGDVMGKGVPAGLIMTMLRGMLRAEVLNQHSPARILQHLNHVMYGDLDNSNRFVTLFYSEYDPKTGMLAFSNAAHNPPILWRAKSQTLEKLDSDGMLIGLDMNTQYEDGEVQLLPGDTVVYYTDGFTEAANPKGARFEEENLLRAIQQACENGYAPQDILDYLFGRIQEFVGVAKHNEDDMTLVILQVNVEREVDHR
ncbi:MAG: PP2C family protein-serine/threonine phosphatase [Cyanobacteria bacterium J06633_2]